MKVHKFLPVWGIKAVAFCALPLVFISEWWWGTVRAWRQTRETAARIREI